MKDVRDLSEATYGIVIQLMASDRKLKGSKGRTCPRLSGPQSAHAFASRPPPSRHPYMARIR